MTPLSGMSRWKNLRAVGLCKDGLIDIRADLAGIDIESRNNLDVARHVVSDLRVHQA